MTSRLSLAAVVAIVIAAFPPVSSTPAAEQGERAQRGRALLEKARRARGGASRLDQMKAIQWRDPDSVTTVLWPDRYRIELLAPFGTITTVFDGTELRQIWPAGAPTRPKPDPTSARSGARRTLAGFALTYLTAPGSLGAVTPVAVGRQTWGPLTGEVIRFVSASASEDAAWGLILDQNMLPSAWLSPSRTSPTGPATAYSLTVMSDYRDVSGLRFPFQTRGFRLDSGRNVTQTLPTRRLEALVVNPPVTRADFAKQ